MIEPRVAIDFAFKSALTPIPAVASLVTSRCGDLAS